GAARHSTTAGGGTAPACRGTICARRRPGRRRRGRTTAGAADHSAGYRRAFGPWAGRRRWGPGTQGAVVAVGTAQRHSRAARRSRTVTGPRRQQRKAAAVLVPDRLHRIFAECRVIPGSGLGSARR